MARAASCRHAVRLQIFPVPDLPGASLGVCAIEISAKQYRLATLFHIAEKDENGQESDYFILRIWARIMVAGIVRSMRGVPQQLQFLSNLRNKLVRHLSDNSYLFQQILKNRLCEQFMGADQSQPIG